MGTAFYFMNNMAILMDILPVGTRGRALGLFQGIEFVGSFIGAPIGALLAVHMTFNQVFYFTLAITLIALPVALRSRGMREADGTASVRSRPALREVFSGLRDWGILAVCLSTLLRMLIMQGIFQTVFQLYMNRTLLFSVASIGVVLSFRIAGQIISLVTAGILSDRVGRRPVLLAGFIVTSLTLTAFTLVKNFELLLLVGFAEGLGEGFGMTTLIALLTDIAPPSMRGGVVGLYRTFQDIGGFSGPVLFMLINNGFGPEYAFYAAAAFSMLNIALISTFHTGQIKAAS